MSLNALSALFLIGFYLDPTAGGMLHFSSSIEYIGLSVMTNDGTDEVLFNDTLEDLGECAKECTTFACLSFTYNTITGSCQGYSKIYSTLESFREDHGSLYYRSNSFASFTTEAAQPSSTAGDVKNNIRPNQH